MIKPRSATPKSLVQLAAERFEQSIKQPTKISKPSKLLPTLKTLALQGLVNIRSSFGMRKQIMMLLLMGQIKRQ